jgi:hypothetical protein
MTADERRAELIQGLRELADFLEANPGLPLGAYPDVELSVFVDHFDVPDTDEAHQAELARIAAELGVEVTRKAAGDHWIARRDFGPVALRYIHTTSQSDADFEAANKVFRAERERLREARKGGTS